MSFSQSFFMGDDTMRELEKCEKKKLLKPGQLDLSTPPSNKKRNKCSDRNADADHRPGRSDLDVIDESPTEKTSILLGQSIKDRLRNVSSISKSKRKYLRRSKSDPITKDADKLNDTRQANKHLHMHRFSEGFFSSFDNEDDHNITNGQIACETEATELNKESVFNEQIDQFFQESIDWESQLRRLDQIKPPIKSPEKQKLNALDENIYDEFFYSKFTLEEENGNISKIESLLKSFDEKTSEDIFKETDSERNPTQLQNKSESKIPGSMSQLLRWDESEFFDSFHEVLNSSLKDAEEKELEAGKEVINTSVADTIELNQSLSQFIAGEMDACKHNVSEALSILDDNVIMQKKSSSIPNSSQLSQSSNIRNVTNSNQPANKVDQNIESLNEWNFPLVILNQYLKKGIKQMFDWQAECLNNPDVSNLTYWMNSGY